MEGDVPNFDLNLYSSDDDSTFITLEPSQRRPPCRNVYNDAVAGLDLESLMNSSTDSAIESVENFRIDGEEDEHVSVLGVEMPQGNNEEKDKQESEVYQPEVEDVSDDDE